MSSFDVVSPVDGRVYAARTYASRDQIVAAADFARKALKDWKALGFDERVRLVNRFLSEIRKEAKGLAESVTWQMGRPIRQADETERLLANAQRIVEDARELLDPQVAEHGDGVKRVVEFDPVGVCFSISAWNYPVAMASSLITAPLLMGNVVLFKHAPQTAIVAEYFSDAASRAGLPPGVFQALHMAHADAESLISSGLIDMVQFVGSVRGGRAVYDAGRGTFLRYGLELGGKDPAYIRADAPLERLVDDFVEGSFGNAGQSCCSVERIYVHREVYREFLDLFGAATEKVTVGHPVDEDTLLGPLVSVDSARRVSGLVKDALSGGAKALLPTGRFPLIAPDTAYVEPQVIVEADHSLALMREEVFGPVVTVTPVDSDEQAIACMNDSDYGLTASVWTRDVERGLELGRQLECGTFYLNRCDHADMYLPWGGVKQSGIGRSYGRQGLEELVVPHAYHLRSSF